MKTSSCFRKSRNKHSSALYPFIILIYPDATDAKFINSNFNPVYGSKEHQLGTGVFKKSFRILPIHYFIIVDLCFAISKRMEY